MYMQILQIGGLRCFHHQLSKACPVFKVSKLSRSSETRWMYLNPDILPD